MAMNTQPETTKQFDPAEQVSFAEAFRVWAKIGFLSFGGPAGQIALMHKMLVEERKWISNDRFLHALNYCNLLPGPEAQQLAIYIGWLLHGTKGGIAAGTLFVIPGMLTIWLLTLIYAGFHHVTIVQALFYGLKPAVLAIVVMAVLRMAGKSLKTPFFRMLSLLAFVAMFFFQLSFPIVIFVSGILGYFASTLCPKYFGESCPAWIAKPINSKDSKVAESEGIVDSLLESQAPERFSPSITRSLAVFFTWCGIWLVPVLLAVLLLGPDHVYAKIAVFFSKMATVTFGGAYAVLAYMAQDAVSKYNWLQSGEMIDGLALAETTPGPLIQVVQFVGFFAAFRHPGSLDPFVAGTLGAFLTVWVTFAPSFLWIFLGAPYVEKLRHNQFMNGALTGITAAVVGVVLNLSVWFGFNAIFAKASSAHVLGAQVPIPDLATTDWFTLLLAAGSYCALRYFKSDMIVVLAGCAGLGWLWKVLV